MTASSPRPAGPDTTGGELRDDRNPKQCPRCGHWCVYDGWDHVHGDGMGIGSCALPALRDLLAERDKLAAQVQAVEGLAAKMDRDNERDLPRWVNRQESLAKSSALGIYQATHDAAEWIRRALGTPTTGGGE